MISKFTNLRILVVATTCLSAAVCLMMPFAPFAQGQPAPVGVITGQITTRPTKAREGVVVHIVRAAGTFRPPATPIVLDQRGMKFLPRVLAILRGTTVSFRNSDNVRHNVFTPDGDRYNLGTWPMGESRTRVFPRAGVFRQLCNVHPEMEGFIIVLDNPHFAVSDASGAFRIGAVPPGNYSLRAWGPRLAEATQPVTVTAGAPVTANFNLQRE